MTFWHVVVRSLVHYRRMHLAVALGVAAATAALVGALLVGDSVRGSLRHLTLDRLGTIDEVLVVDRFFAAGLVDELGSNPTFQQHYRAAVGAILFGNGTAERAAGDTIDRAANINIIATAGQSPDRAPFWRCGVAAPPQRLPGDGEVLINAALARQLRVKVGTEITVRLPKPEDIPADSPLGEKVDLVRTLPRLEVIGIVPDEGLGAFALRPAQRVPRNVYLNLDYLQDALHHPAQINAILVAGDQVAPPPGEAASKDLAAVFQPTLEDLGLVLRQPRLAYAEKPDADPQIIYDYYSVSSQRMILPPAVEEAAISAFAKDDGQPVFTYLANLMRKLPDGGRPVPYSMVTAIDPSTSFSLSAADGPPITALADDAIVLTDWAANEMQVAVGDTIAVTCFKPETTHGQPEEAVAKLRVSAITPLARPRRPYLPDRVLDFASKPTMANDPELTPTVAGVTDERSISDWEVPFTVDYQRIESADEAYWLDYGTTPKAYVSLRTGRRLWGSRFGQSTSIRIPVTPALSATRVRTRLMKSLAEGGDRLGFEFIPVKRRQLAASAGNTPFDVLFIMLSFFVIAAALMLVAILFRLGFEQRARTVGTLAALGWSTARIRRLLLSEAFGVSTVGGLIGVVVGCGYAWLLLAALSSKDWWLGAIGTPFLQYHYSVTSLIVGFVAGSLISLLTLAVSIWRSRHVPACQLLRGVTTRAEAAFTRPPLWLRGLVALLGLFAVATALSGMSLEGEARAGAFVGAGFTALAALLLWLWLLLRAGGSRQSSLGGSWPMVRLAARSAARNPLRSTLTVGLIGMASFMIVAMSAFQLRPTESGTGGFALVGESSQPVFADLNDAKQRADLFGPAADALAQTHIYGFRLRPGDDASCGNLYQASQPQVLGVSDTFIARFDDATLPQFHWMGFDSTKHFDNPWHVLQPPPAAAGDAIPVVIDHDMAVYSLHLYNGIGEEFTCIYDGRPVRMRVAGLLAISVLHGSLLMGESNFRQAFPEASGHRRFLIDAPSDQTDAIAQQLEKDLTDEGFDASNAAELLTGLMAIQNTYLRTFQALGALGLLLGTFGLAAVQWRSVLERRGEMGLLRATGFRKQRLFQLVLYESVTLLLLGLLVGTLTAGVAIIPHVFSGGASVPVAELSALLAIVLLVGLVAGSAAAWAGLRVPLLTALRQEA